MTASVGQSLGGLKTLGNHGSIQDQKEKDPVGAMGKNWTGKRRKKETFYPEAIQQPKNGVAVRLRNTVKVNTQRLN